MMATHSRTLAAGAALILGASLLSGCAASGADRSGPSAVEEAFLQALADGDGDAAVALTTLDRDDVSCWNLISDYESYSVGIATPNDVEDAKVDGNTATVEFHYTMVSNQAKAQEVTGEHSLVLEDDRWLIEFPEEYRIVASVPADIVADVGFREIGTTDGALDCRESIPNGGSYEVIALPGSYSLETDDPTGVFRTAVEPARVMVSDAAPSGETIELNADDSDRELKEIEVRNALAGVVGECVTSDFANSCPERLPSPADGITLGRTYPDRYTDYPTVTRIYSDDAETWRFEAGEQDFLFQWDGVETRFPMEYSGQIIAPAEEYGPARIVLD